MSTGRLVVAFLVSQRLCQASTLWPYGAAMGYNDVVDPRFKQYENLGVSMRLIWPSTHPKLDYRIGRFGVHSQGSLIFEDVKTSTELYYMTAWVGAMDLLANKQGNIYYRHGADPRDVAMATDDVRAAFGSAYENFTASYVIVVTFHNVTYKGGDDNSLTNTAQLIMTTNWNETFMYFNMGTIGWTAPMIQKPGLIGVIFVHPRSYCTHPGSSPNSTRTLMEATNGCQPGRVMWRVDTGTCLSPDPHSCRASTDNHGDTGTTPDYRPTFDNVTAGATAGVTGGLTTDVTAGVTGGLTAGGPADVPASTGGARRQLTTATCLSTSTVIGIIVNLVLSACTF